MFIENQYAIYRATPSESNMIAHYTISINMQSPRDW